MYSYSQHSGTLYLDGTLFAVGFAGRGHGKNNPTFQDVANIGPLPRGKYVIGPVYTHPKLGPCVMNLYPFADNQMFGRSDFRIHGASLTDPEKSSEGCIILPRSIREEISTDEKRILEVTE